MIRIHKDHFYQDDILLYPAPLYHLTHGNQRPSQNRRGECQEGQHIVFNNTQRAKKTELYSSSTSSLTSASSSTTTSFSSKPSDTFLSHDDIQEFNVLSQCKKQNGQPIKPAILSLVKGHSHNQVTREIQLDMPIPLTELYHKDNRSLSKEALLQKAEEVFWLCLVLVSHQMRMLRWSLPGRFLLWIESESALKRV